MNDIPQETNLLPMKNRRRWSQEEKKSILAEAESSNVSETARRHGIATGLLFQWRRQLQGRRGSTIRSTKDVNPAEELVSALSRNIRKFDRVEQMGERLQSDLDNGKVTAYNASNAFASLIRAFATLQAQRFEILDRMADLLAIGTRKNDDEYDPENIDFAVEKEAERACFEIVRAEVERKRAEAATKSPGAT